ncbi:MAG: hypothetical protein IPO93_00115 [Actinobacteria bacterium]|nr:hypothetical protein [Actinomycetota bacterium]
MSSARPLAVVLGALTLAAVAVPAPASANATLPAVGECFLITDKQTYEGYWPGASPVPCSGKHSFEVTKSSDLPADVNAFDFAEAACDYASVWKQLGVNQPRAGMVRNPVRIEAFSFAIRGGGSVRPSYICGAGPVAFRGKKGAVLTTMTGPIKGMGAATKASLLYCNSAAGGRDAFAPPVSVPCTKTPRWQVLRWVMWASIYTDYPGEDVISAAAAQLCGPGREYSYPTEENWATGSKRTFCYTRIP